MAIDTIWEKAPYVNQAAFSPDGKQLLVAGAGDAFDGIGQNIKQGQISNSYDGQLFLYDLASRKASPLTKDFNPNVIDAVWNRFNGQSSVRMRITNGSIRATRQTGRSSK